MEIPRTANEAARALLLTAEHADNPTALGGNPDGDPWAELTDPRVPERVAIDIRRRRRLAFSREGTNPDRPPVIVALPLVYLPRGFTWLAADPRLSVMGDDGVTSPYPCGPIASGMVHPNGRPRLAVIPGPEASPGPRGAHALTVCALACRYAADGLDGWAADRLSASDATRARAEAATYRDYAAEAEALIPAAFSWLSDVPEPLAVLAFPTVPAVLHGTAQLGTT